MDLELRDRVVIVTGSSRGIGRSIATALAHEGAHLVLGARDPEQLEATAQAVRDLGARVATVSGDLTSADRIADLVDAAMSAFGRVDGLACCIGSTPIGTFAEIDDDTWTRSFETKLLATVRAIRSAAPKMRESGGGRIVVVAGSTAQSPAPHMVTSSVVNSGLRALVAALSDELSPDGIGVVTLDPGLVETDRYSAVLQYVADSTGASIDEARGSLTAKIPRGVIAAPHDVGRMGALLLSPIAAHVTGTSILFDGGQAARN